MYTVGLHTHTRKPTLDDDMHTKRIVSILTARRALQPERPDIYIRQDYTKTYYVSLQTQF